MGLEEKLTEYLKAYGNTRETDLVNFGAEKLGQNHEKVKRIVDRMAVKGKIHRIVHNKLKPPEVYISLEEPLPPDTEIDHEAAEEIARILDDAATLADRITGNRKH